MLDLTAMDACVLTYASAGEGLEKFLIGLKMALFKFLFYFFSFLSFLCFVFNCDLIKRIFLYIFNIIAILLTLSISPFFFLHYLIYPSVLSPPSLPFCKSPFRHLRVFS